MEKMTKDEMIDFLRDMKRRQRNLEKEKQQVRNCVEEMDEAIRRNAFGSKSEDIGFLSGGFSPDKIFRILMNSKRDIEEETKQMIQRMKEIYKVEDKIAFVNNCMLQIPVREQELIKAYYVEDEPVEIISRKVNLSSTYLYKLIKKGLRDLLAIYNQRCESTNYSRAERLIREIRPYMSEGSIA